MSIKVTDVKGQDYDINLKDGQLDKADEDFSKLAIELGLNAVSLSILMQGSIFNEGENVPLDTLLEKIVNDAEEPTSPENVKELLAKFKEIVARLPGLESDVEAATQEVVKKQAAFNSAAPDKKAEAQVELEKAKKELELAKKVAESAGSEMKAAKKQLNDAATKGFMNTQDALKDQIKQATGQAAAPKGAAAPDSPPPASPFNSNPGNGGGAAGKATADGKAGADPYAGFGGGAYKAGAGPYSAVDAVGFNDNFINDSWDMISESQKRQKMLMLFFYYAKMAMSGDIGAMYQFMRFLAHVIGRDKALQNVWMGTKLLELQEQSRQNTKDLLATDADDKDGAWTKKLQTIKGDENMIATSQKLITQMMEEFTQIVETLTNVQKSLLDVNGKVLSNLSQWR